jgi:uncharacterized protein (DUF1697 family)
MAQYVALLRGVMPSNPNMHQAKLKGVLEALGYAQVRPVISSGNVVFESPERRASTLEAQMEAAWPAQLGFTSTTLVRSRRELERIVALDPFAGLDHSKQTYLLVTFFKRRLKLPFSPPFEPAGRPWRIVGAADRVIFTVIDTTAGETPDLMGWMDKSFAKEVSSRTWKTVQRILAVMERNR